jgi:hypothetical protein
MDPVLEASARMRGRAKKMYVSISFRMMLGTIWNPTQWWCSRVVRKMKLGPNSQSETLMDPVLVTLEVFVAGAWTFRAPCFSAALAWASDLGAPALGFLLVGSVDMVPSSKLGCGKDQDSESQNHDF